MSQQSWQKHARDTGSAESGRKRARSPSCVPADISPIFCTCQRRQQHSSLLICKGQSQERDMRLRKNVCLGALNNPSLWYYIILIVSVNHNIITLRTNNQTSKGAKHNHHTENTSLCFGNANHNLERCRKRLDSQTTVLHTCRPY